MSMAAITWALNVKTGSPSSKLVLLKLADQANDEGKCWPSVRLMERHTELSERAIRAQIKALENLGFLKVEKRFSEGVQLPNVYYLNLHQTVGVVHNMQGGGAGGAPGVVQEVQANSKPSEENPNLTHNSLADAKPSFQGKNKFSVPDWVPKEPWDAFVEMRKKIRAPLTDRAKAMCLKELKKVVDAGEDPGDVLDQSTGKSWRGLFPIKFSNGAHNGKRQSAHDNLNAGTVLYLEKLARESRGEGEDSDSPDTPRKLLLAP